MRTALRSLAGAIGTQAHALSTESLVDSLSLLGRYRLLSDTSALNLVTALYSRFEKDSADDVLLSSCATAMVQLRSSYEGTDADQVAGGSATAAGMPPEVPVSSYLSLTRVVTTEVQANK